MYNFGEVVRIGTVNYLKKWPMHNCADIQLRKGSLVAAGAGHGVELNSMRRGFGYSLSRFQLF